MKHVTLSNLSDDQYERIMAIANEPTLIAGDFVELQDRDNQPVRLIVQTSRGLISITPYGTVGSYRVEYDLKNGIYRKLTREEGRARWRYV